MVKMKGKSHRIVKKERSKMKGTLCGNTTKHLQLQLGQFLHHQPSSTSSAVSCFQNLLDAQAHDASSSHVPVTDDDVAVDDRDFILSQDFFCTPDYITPDNQHIFNGFDCDKENTPCPKSPEKLNTTKSKRCRLDAISVNPLSTFSGDHQPVVELGKDSVTEEVAVEKTSAAGKPKAPSYVSHSAVALRCRVMPPPCIKNPYLKDVSEKETDPFGNQRSKCAGLFPEIAGGDGLSRYRTDFHEIEQIGRGNFSSVFKVLRRIDGCLYAVKRSRQLRQETERRKALMEVQALAALGLHENIVGYYSSWFENEQLYIQMELCDHSLSIKKCTALFKEEEVIEALFQVANALRFIHEKGIAHLDVKPDNIYVKNGVFKLGDFGCATLLDNSLPIEEGDARYMPQEILNENYDHLDKVDIFSLGASIYELIRRLPLPESGCQFFNLKEGKFPLLPGYSLQLQNLLKVMMDHDPVKRPSAREIVENPIFYRAQRTVYTRKRMSLFRKVGANLWNDGFDGFSSDLSREANGDGTQELEKIELLNKPSSVHFFKGNDYASNENEEENKKVNVEYYELKPGDFVVGVVVSGKENKLDVNVGADLVGTMLTKEVLPLYGKEMGNLICDMKREYLHLLQNMEAILVMNDNQGGNEIHTIPVFMNIPQSPFELLQYHDGVQSMKSDDLESGREGTLLDGSCKKYLSIWNPNFARKKPQGQRKGGCQGSWPPILKTSLQKL
ncbi:hypothetical protein VNO77_17995 [Canavalia gladiata]|uniref:Wee1-like protein kinase n=1 Tax=Canavalia gladiata TaxID=3824 RepID=A0AAN9LKQ4_CANGL